MQVAVAGVEDVADAQPVLARELGDPAQHLGQLRARHDAVLDVVVGATRPIAANAALRPRQMRARSCRRPRRCGARSAPYPAADRLDRGEVLRDLAAAPSSSTIRTAPAPAGSPGATAASAASIVSASIISIAAGTIPAPMTSRDGGAGRVDRVEAGEQRPHRLGRAQDPHVISVTIPSVPRSRRTRRAGRGPASSRASATSSPSAARPRRRARG